MANAKKNIREDKIDAAEKIAEVKVEAAAEPAAKIESVTTVKNDAKIEPAAKIEKTPAKSENAAATKDDAPKTAAKRGRKPASEKAEKTEKTAKTSAAKSEKTKTSAKSEKASDAKSEKTAAAKKDNASKAAAKKNDAPKTTAKKEDAPKTAAKRGRKPAAEKTDTKASAKKTGKSTSKKAEEKAPSKRGRKKSLTYASIVDAAKKKVNGADISRIKYPIAVNVELKNSVEGIFYIVVSDGKINVEPYKYDDYDVYIEADAAEFVNVLNGKKNIYDALADGSVTFGNCNLKKTILFINAVL